MQPCQSLIQMRAATSSIKWNPELVEKWCGSAPADMLSFWVADMDFPAPAPITSALQQVVDKKIYGYSDIDSPYRDAVVSWFQRRYDCSIQPNWIVYSNGIVPALNYALQSFCAPGDKLVLQPPVYYPFMQAAANNGVGVLENPLLYDGATYHIDFADLEKKLADPAAKIMFFCSPHNPVGRVWRREEVAKVAALCSRHGALLVADEIHADIVFSPHRHHCLASFGAHLQNLVLCTSPSKTFNIAGLQMSNIIIPNVALREQFYKGLQRNGILLPNIFGVAGAKAAYSEPECEAWLKGVLHTLEGNIQLVRSHLEAHLPRAHMCEAEGTYLAWIDMGAYGPAGPRAQMLEKEGRVMLDHGSIFGAAGEAFERINFACPKGLLQQGLNRIAQALEPNIHMGQ